MSINTVELALHHISTDRHARAEFKADAARFLKRYALKAEEQFAIEKFDVRSLQTWGASPLLTYGFWLTAGEQRTRAAYLAALRNAAGEAHYG